MTLCTLRMLGTEIEYGIIVTDQPLLSSIVSSTHIIKSYVDSGLQENYQPPSTTTLTLGGLSHGAEKPVENTPQLSATDAQTPHQSWDYHAETPTHDARGFVVEGRVEGQPTEFGITNRMLSNGARFYVDHAHPEYSSPELSTPLQVVTWEKAGDQIMAAAIDDCELATRLQPSVSTDQPIVPRIFKNNVDNKGASYGAHENYSCSRDTPFEDFAEALTIHFVSRQIYCGAGRLGLGQFSEQPGFQISQRADYIEVDIGLETTVRRGIINTRDEPHCDAQQWRRMHVIVGDANMSDTAIFLKSGTTALVLDAIESGVSFSDLTYDNPVTALHQISRDITLTSQQAMSSGAALTALEVQREILARCTDVVNTQRGTDSFQSWKDQVLQEWSDVLDLLHTDIFSARDRVDWVAKLHLFNAYRERENLQWDDAKLHSIDLQYCEIRNGKTLFSKLVDSGRMRTMVQPESIYQAMTTPPSTTRAYRRGTLISRHHKRIMSASWESLTSVDSTGYTSHLVMADPGSGTEAECTHNPALLDIDHIAT